MADQYLFVIVYSIDGIEHTRTGYAINAKEVKKHFDLIAAHHEMRVPDEKMKLLRIHFRVTPDEQVKIVSESVAKNPDQTTTDPRLLGNPQAEVISFEQ